MKKTGKVLDATEQKIEAETSLTKTTDTGRQSELAEKRVSETIWDTLSQMFQTSSKGKPNLMDFIRDSISSTARDIELANKARMDKKKFPKIKSNRNEQPNH